MRSTATAALLLLMLFVAPVVAQQTATLDDTMAVTSGCFWLHISRVTRQSRAVPTTSKPRHSVPAKYVQSS